MKAVYLKKEFRMSANEIKEYNLLPDNLPENKLNQKQKDLVNRLYYKYISCTIDNQDWSENMYQVEKKEGWPSGPRIKEHEAKRIILCNLVYLNESKKELTIKEAAKFFHSAMSCREMYIKLINKCYCTDKLYI